MNNIKHQHVYWINFNPVQRGEFPDKHLAIVLGVNDDQKSCRVLPLTRLSTGLGDNKISLGKLHNFSDISYAVLDQVRTVSFRRMSQHMENNCPVEIKVSDQTFYDVKSAIMLREEINLSQVQLMDYHTERLIELKKKHIINLLYRLKKSSDKESDILLIKDELDSNINHLIDITDFITNEHPELLPEFCELNVSMIELNVETA